MRFRRSSSRSPIRGRTREQPAPPRSILDEYVREAPSPQLAVDIFHGEWSTALPPEAGVVAGEIGLYTDPRIEFFIERAGGVDGRSVVELGPLEAGHTYMLERAGATVTAIESNSRAFLKCLIVKEIVPLTRSRFLFGDFLPYLESTDDRPHLLVASGVLYHAPDPIRLLRAMARVSNNVGLWTHHFDPATMQKPEFERLFDPPFGRAAGDRWCTLHRRHYREALEFAGFCGGAEQSAVWMELADIIGVLADEGFHDVVVSSNDVDHPYGAAVLLHARRD
jgi:hypothetical protein